MDFSGTELSDAGFATPAATIISLTLGLTVAAATSAAIAELRSSRADFEHARIENLISGIQSQAALQTLAAGAAGRLHWTVTEGDESLDVLAEPEVMKATPATAAALDDTAFVKLRITNLQALKDRLETMSAEDALGPALDDADPSPNWRACARSMISPFGQNTQLQITAARDFAQYTTAGRAGEAWRIRVADANGWQDDRVVRFTGDLGRPVVIVWRRFGKQDGEGEPCDAFFNRTA